MTAVSRYLFSDIFQGNLRAYIKCTKYTTGTTLAFLGRILANFYFATYYF
jgi:hypothetical protein